MDDEGNDTINIGAQDIDQLLPEGKELIKEKALLDKNYSPIGNQLSSGDVIDKHYELIDVIICWKK